MQNNVAWRLECGKNKMKHLQQALKHFEDLNDVVWSLVPHLPLFGLYGKKKS